MDNEFQNEIDKLFNRKETKKNRYCTNCGRTIPFDAKICPYCMKKFTEY
jgi:predicted amidophosphoribosyltransferase